MKIALSKFLNLAGKDKGIAPALVALDKETKREIEDMQKGYAALCEECGVALKEGDSERARALIALKSQAYTLIDMLKDHREIVIAAQRKAATDGK